MSILLYDFCELVGQRFLWAFMSRLFVGAKFWISLGYFLILFCYQPFWARPYDEYKLIKLLQFHQGDTLDYLGIPGLHLAGSQGVIVIAICQVLLMVTTLCSFLFPLSSHKTMANLILHNRAFYFMPM